MKKHYLAIILGLCTYMAQAQCIGTFEYPTPATTSFNTGSVQTISTCNFGGDFATITGLIPGDDYQFTSSLSTDYITITDASNAVLASGLTPLDLSAVNTDTVRMHIHINASCGTDLSCHTTTIQCVTCTPPPAPANDDCSSVTPVVLVNGDEPIVFNGSTVGATASASETSVLEVAAVWEAVELTASCSDLLVDYCGTTPGNMDTAFVIYSDCLTEFTPGEYEFDTCPDGNVTINFYGLPAGVYYLPVLADPAYNPPGEYVMTVSSISCPDAPVCASEPIFPADGATNVEPINPITFTWTAPTTGPTPTSYDFYGGVDPGALNLFGNVTDTQFEIAIGDYDLLIYWQVVPRNGSATASGCPIWSLRSAPFEFLGYCLNNDYDQWPTAAVTPTTCDGTTANLVVNNGWASEYAVVNVTAGQTYQFTSTLPDLITLSYDGVSPEAYGVSEVTWTATTTGGVRFYTHLNDDACGAEEVSRVKSVVCGGTLGIDAFDFTSLNVYPNPVKGLLNLRAPAAIQQVAIYNMLGQEVLITAPNNMVTQIEMSALNVGTYFVKVTINDRTETIKVVKQ